MWDLFFRHQLSELELITLSHVGINLAALILSLTGVQIETASGGNLNAIKKIFGSQVQTSKRNIPLLNS